MGFSSYSTSRYFFDFSCDIPDPVLAQSKSIRGRAHCFGAFLEKVAILPFALLFKFYKTFFRASGVLVGAAFLCATLGTSGGAREFFEGRVSALAKDLADWVLYPFAVLVCCSRLLLASLVHPALHFRF
jgi:hypothetical protein